MSPGNRCRQGLPAPAVRAAPAPGVGRPPPAGGRRARPRRRPRAPPPGLRGPALPACRPLPAAPALPAPGPGRRRALPAAGPLPPPALRPRPPPPARSSLAPAPSQPGRDQRGALSGGNGMPSRYTTRLVRMAVTVGPGTITPTRFSGSDALIVTVSPVFGCLRTDASCSTAPGRAYCSPLKPDTNRPPRTSPRSSSRRRAHCNSRHGSRSESCTARSWNTTPHRLSNCSATASARSCPSRSSAPAGGTSDQRPVDRVAIWASRAAGREAPGPGGGPDAGHPGPDGFEAVAHHEAPAHAVPEGPFDVVGEPPGRADQIGGEASAPLLEDLDYLRSRPDRRAHRLPGGPPGRATRAGRSGTPRLMGVALEGAVTGASASSRPGGASLSHAASPAWHSRSSQAGL